MTDLLKPLHGAPIPGGCDHCAASTTVTRTPTGRRLDLRRLQRVGFFFRHFVYWRIRLDLADAVVRDPEAVGDLD